MSIYSEEFLRLLMAVSEVAIVAFTDKRGRITFANKQFCTISGYTFEELINRDHRLLNSEYHPPEFFRQMYQTIHLGKVWRGDIQNKSKDGTYYWVDTQIIPIFNEEGIIESFASVRFDITERKQMENAIISLEKMASLGEMSAVVAHEINNPLAIIQLCIDSLKKEILREDYTAEFIVTKLDKMNISIGRIVKLVRGLKTFSRTSGLEEYSEINLKSFVEDVLSFSKCKCASEGIIFNTKTVPDISIECRPDQISQVMLNLLNNAFDAVSNLDEKWIDFSIEIDLENNEAVFLFKDSGKGIPDQIADKILNPFFTTKDIGKGTGLGLSISRAIIEEHEGVLYLENKDCNTLFVFKIPIWHKKVVAKVS